MNVSAKATPLDNMPVKVTLNMSYEEAVALLSQIEEADDRWPMWSLVSGLRTVLSSMTKTYDHEIGEKEEV